MQSINNPVVAVLAVEICGCRTRFYSFSPAELGVSWYPHPSRFGGFREKAQNCY
jgi:hypothetical protein